MRIQKECLTPADLEQFDAENFKPDLAMNLEEWAEVFSSGVVEVWTARDEQDKIAAVCVLKSVINVSIVYCFSIAVGEKYRNLGLGRQLYNAAIIDLAPGTRIQAHCELDNAASIQLHKSVGFEAIQYINDFYGDYKDAILWQKVR